MTTPPFSQFMESRESLIACLRHAYERGPKTAPFDDDAAWRCVGFNWRTMENARAELGQLVQVIRSGTGQHGFQWRLTPKTMPLWYLAWKIHQVV